MDTDGNPITREQLVQRIQERSLLPSDREGQTLCSGASLFSSGLTSYLTFTTLWSRFAKRPMAIRMLASGLGGATAGFLTLGIANMFCMSKFMNDVLTGTTKISNREKAIDTLMAQGKWRPQQNGPGATPYGPMGMGYQPQAGGASPYGYPPYYAPNVNQMNGQPPNAQQFQPQPQPPAQQFQSQQPTQQFQPQPQSPAQQFQPQSPPQQFQPQPAQQFQPQPAQQFQPQPQPPAQQFQSQQPTQQFQPQPPAQQFQPQPQSAQQFQLSNTQFQPQPPFFQKQLFQQNQPQIPQNQTSPLPSSPAPQQTPPQSQSIPQPAQSPFGESNQQFQPNSALIPPYKPPLQTYQPPIPQSYQQQPGYPGYSPAPAYGNRFAPYLPPPVSNAPVSHLERTLPIPPYAQSIQGMPPGGPARGVFPGGVPPGVGGFPGGPGGMTGVPFGYQPNAMMGQPLPQRPYQPYQQQNILPPPALQFPPQTNPNFTNQPQTQMQTQTPPPQAPPQTEPEPSMASLPPPITNEPLEEVAPPPLNEGASE